ncbi:restriction endonuclease subunit S [Microbulbifer litoralis]|uniref:restriction endonuclease subunit S n=1 Tax=Microbulbifer litoralis TaxID=2933965 RepID=UPI00202778AE
MSWPHVKIGAVATINPRLPKDIDPMQEVSFLGMASVSEEGQLLNEEPRILADVKKGFTYFERGDVLLAKITPCFENGKCLRSGKISREIGFGSTEFHVVRVDEGKLDAKYLFYMVWSDRFRFFGEKSMSGAAGQKRVSADFLRDYEIPLPHLKEQQRIATILDKADAIRRKRQQAIALADEFLRAVFLDMFGDVGGDGWAVETIESIAKNEKGSIRTGPFGSQLLHSEFVDSGISVLGIDNAVDNRFRWGKSRFITREKYEQLSRYTVHPGDVLITIMGTCGRCAVVPENVPTAINTKHLCCITLDEEKALPEFLHSYYLYHPMARSYLSKTTKGAIMDGLNMGIIKDMPFPLVPLDLQVAFVAVKEKVSSLMGGLSESSTEDAELLGALGQNAFSDRL